MSSDSQLVEPADRAGGRKPVSRRLVRAWTLTAALVLVAAGCGNSADPESWEEAEEHGFTDPETGDAYNSAVEFNFVSACLLANTEDTGGDLNAQEARVLCQCAFNDLRDSLTFQEFRDLDKALRDTPNPSDLDEEPEDTWDDRAEGILETCASRVDA